jgi:PAS domain S-box-containing protein
MPKHSSKCEAVFGNLLSGRPEVLLSEERHRLALEAAKAGVWDLDVETGNCYFSSQCASLLGYLPDELPRRLDEWDQLVHGVDLEFARGAIANCVSGRTKDVEVEFRLNSKDGRWIWFLCQGKAAALDPAGRARRIVGTLIDITQTKREHEQVLADSDRLLRETQRIAQLGSYVLDLVNDSWSCSSILRAILGIEEGFPLNLLGHFEIVHPDFRDNFMDNYLAAVMTSSLFEMEYKIIRHKDGEERWVAECSEVKIDAAGRARRMIGTIQDITDRKSAEEAIHILNNDLDRRVIERTSQLAAAKKEIESFSYSVSHDLRAPLRHINSYSAILMEEYGDLLPTEGRYYLERIRTSSSRMGKLIDDLLTLTRVSRTTMKRERFNISSMAADVASMLRDGDAESPARFVIKEGLHADGDSTLVRVVLQNLLSNSLKYAGRRESPTIEFGEIRKTSQQAFFVRDDGVGFDMAYAENLFQPFQRLHGSEFEGTGIGLATVKRIIERHGGSIWAEGKENEGATFYFTLSQS